METPQPLPSLNLPSSGEVVQVFAIDNGARIHLRTNFLLLPDVGGQEYIHFPSYVFLVQHPSGRKVLFDLGIRKDWENAAPSVMRQIMGSKSEITSPENIIDVLKRHGIQGQEIEAVIWSHFHFDQ
jgi:glyoxylase-like metal-dependent hydrolase (beta-lactamase superfamily II)